jgi:hypothetical protein
MLVGAVKYKDILSDTFYAHKDNSLIKLVLDEGDWECISDLVDILKPLKEATLMVSQGGEALCISNVIPLFQFCAETLKTSLGKVVADEDIYVGIEAAIEKLEHYYDMVSPMVGISLSLRMKRDYLKNILRWRYSWLESVESHFASAFQYYKSCGSTASTTRQTTSTRKTTSLYSSFISNKRQRIVPSNSAAVEDEFVRYYSR